MLRYRAMDFLPCAVSLTLRLFVVVLALAGPGSGFQGPPGRGRISWSVPEVSETVRAGSSKPVRITLLSAQDLSNVTLWVSPSLEQVLSIKPVRFDTLAAGRNYEVTLTFAARASEPAGEHGGTMHVKLGEATVPVPLTIAVKVIRP